MHTTMLLVEATMFRHSWPRWLLRVTPFVVVLSDVSMASAQWPAEGTLIDEYVGRGLPIVRMIDAPSGDVFVCIMASGNATNWRVRRIRPDGSVPAGWGYGGPAHYGNMDPSDLFGAAQAPDSKDGLFLLSKNAGYSSPSHSVLLQRVQSDATMLPAASPPVWPIAQLTPVLTFRASVASAPSESGGVYVAWTRPPVLRLQRRWSDGSIAPGWTTFGHPVGRAAELTPLAIQADGTGGVVMAWIDSFTRILTAQRVLRDTTHAPGWPTAGLVLSTPTFFGPWDELIDQFLVPSGPNHFIVAVKLEGDLGNSPVFLNRFGLDGVIDPAWNGGLVALDNSDSLSATSVVSDGLGGVHVVGRAGPGPRAGYRWSHVSSSGQFVTPNGPAGVSPLDAGAETWGWLAVRSPAIAATPGGGLIVGWNDFRHGIRSARVRWLLPDGSADPAEPDTGRVVSNLADEVCGLHPDGSGGAYVTTYRYFGPSSNNSVRVHRLYASGVVSTPPAQPPTSMHLATPWPQPARGSFSVRYSLASEAAARLELFDLSGRRVLARDVVGGADRVARIDLGPGTAPGLYHLRLTQGQSRQATRLVVAR